MNAGCGRWRCCCWWPPRCCGAWGRKGPPVLTFEQIDHLVRKSIEEKPLASAAARAYDKIIPSVVRVVGYERDGDDRPAKRKAAKEARDARPKSESSAEPGMQERGVGTGVVIVDNGTILTNLHVVLGAERVKVTFIDGLESEARLISVMPENDLAVLRAVKIPDDLHAGHDARHRRPEPGRPRDGGGLSVRHRAVGVGRRGLRA